MIQVSLEIRQTVEETGGIFSLLLTSASQGDTAGSVGQGSCEVVVIL